MLKGVWEGAVIYWRIMEGQVKAEKKKFKIMGRIDH